MREFKIERNPNDCGNLYTYRTLSFEPGLTVLVGCNGTGKTTLLRMIKEHLEIDEVPYIFYDNLNDGNERARSAAGFYGDMDFLAISLCSSEGENINLNLGNVVRKIGGMLRKNRESKELWILLDGIDSGLSIDNIVETKDFFRFLFEENKGKDIYIIASANEYELCNGERCMDIYNGKEIRFKTYNAYKKFILKSKARKERRIERENKKNKS